MSDSPAIASVQTSELTQLPIAKRKGYRLFKRDLQCCEMQPSAEGWRDRPYFFRFQFRGKSYVRCLETTDAVEAQKRARFKAKQIKEAIIRGEYGDLPHLRSAVTYKATVAQVCNAYVISAGDASERTRRQNVLALHQLLKVAYGQDLTVDRLIASEINTTVARKWFEAATAKVAATADQNAALSIKESANSRFVQAASVFTDRARASYASQDLDHVAFTEFLKAGAVQKFRRLPTRHYNPPSQHLIDLSIEAWRQIEDRNLFLAIGHELAFGLRKGEIAQAKWGWWTLREGYPVIDGEANVKNGSGRVQVRALDPWFQIMRERAAVKAWRGGSDDFIITGNNTFRSEDIFRAVSEWLRKLGWETQKTNHALRAYAGSQVAMRYGIYEAQCWLRHSTVKVTEEHYTHFIKAFRPADLDALPARWATLQQTLELRIVERSTL